MWYFVVHLEPTSGLDFPCVGSWPPAKCVSDECVNQSLSTFTK